MDIVKIQHIGGKISEISNAKRVVFTEDGNWVHIDRIGGNTLVVNARTVECVSIPKEVFILMHNGGEQR